MKYLSVLGFALKILWVGVVVLFALTEFNIFIAFRQLPSDRLFSGIETKYIILFIAAMPMVAGINGYRSVKRRLSSAGDEVISVLSIQFLLTIIMAYAALIFCVGPLSHALQTALK